MTRALLTIIAGGFLAGTFDAVAAILVFNVHPDKLFQFIASAAFGNEAFTGGTTTALWGLFFHYLIAFSWTILFFLIYPFLHRYSKNWRINGLIYGILIWLVMNHIIIPLTRLPHAPFDLTKALTGIIIIIFAVSMPVAWLTHRYYKTNVVQG